MSAYSTLSPVVAEGRLADAVYATLRKAILDFDLPPDTPLSVPELARRFNVSRSPVREAVLQLTTEGWAAELPHRGAVVVRFGLADLFEVHDMREVLEGLAARRAAENSTARDVRGIAEILDRQGRIVAAQDAAGYAATNHEFHQTIARLSGSRHLMRALEHLYDQKRLAILAAAAWPGHTDQGHAEHHEILRAIEDRDGARAEAAMRAHFVRTRPRQNTEDNEKLRSLTKSSRGGST